MNDHPDLEGLDPMMQTTHIKCSNSLSIVKTGKPLRLATLAISASDKDTVIPCVRNFETKLPAQAQSSSWVGKLGTRWMSKASAWVSLLIALSGKCLTPCNSSAMTMPHSRARLSLMSAVTLLPKPPSVLRRKSIHAQVSIRTGQAPASIPYSYSRLVKRQSF
jgi:hypothetical protein